MATATNSPKMQALKANPKVVLTIDTNEFPPHILLVRGSGHVEIVDGVASEFLEPSRRFVLPKQWEEFEKGVTALYKQQRRITIVPEWANVVSRMIWSTDHVSLFFLSAGIGRFTAGRVKTSRRWHSSLKRIGMRYQLQFVQFLGGKSPISSSNMSALNQTNFS